MAYRVTEVDSDYLEKKIKKDKSSTKFPKCFKVKVNMEKVNFPIVKDWIYKKINEQLPDDEIVIDYIYELLQENEGFPDIKAIQLQLQDFLGQAESLDFCEKLWKLLISAQKDEDGIPKEIIEQRKRELEELESKKKEKKEVKSNKTEHEIGDSSSGRREENNGRKTNYNRSQYNASKREIIKDEDKTKTEEPKGNGYSFRSRSEYSRDDRKVPSQGGGRGRGNRREDRGFQRGSYRYRDESDNRSRDRSRSRSRERK
ncbi:PWI domain-containing protein [Scheffersomyces xylosifermentans]|uniref:PWI domain-containing protein n=1 Tax=Scheffersomyces xylosifermentans TaxID=1304137 RepID=UPI00315DAF8E